MTGQMFLIGKPAPLFIIREISTSMYQVLVVSETAGTLLGKSDILKPFSSVGEAAAWAYEFSEY
jgi:hypothetical protein